MDRSPSFGSIATNFRPLKTRFRCGSALLDLTSLAAITRWPILQKVRSHPVAFSNMGLLLFVGIRFQVLFTPLPGFFSPFPHGTLLYRLPGSI
jgi:hypothetical protein